jgi:hypothetical protein
MTFASDADLERGLYALGAYVDFPDTPDLATAVRARLQQRRRQERWWPRALAVAAALAVVLFVVGLAVSPEARQAVADRLGIGSVQVTEVPEVPTVLPSSTPSGAPSPPPGATLNLGTRVSLDEAQRRYGAALLLPAELGPPDAVYAFGNSTSAQEVSLVYAPRPGLPASSATRGVGLVLSLFRASVDENLVVQKGVGPKTTIQEVRVGASRGLWIAGAPHLFLRSPGGAIRDVAARLAGNTLLWEQDSNTLRLESGLDREAAIQVAESVRSVGNP